MEKSFWYILTILVLLTPAAAEGTEQQRLFESVFGEAAKLDPATVERVRALPPRQKLYLDTSGDGRHDQCWFIDNSLRHSARVRPLLVKVVDEDGDMHLAGPDLDSDLYLADWNADGFVDAAVDYTDLDGDQDVDEMGIYTYEANLHRLGGRPGLLVWWSGDLGDDNLLWYDVNYAYSQPLGQFRCDFSGDEVFASFALSEDGKRWIPFWENPFVFFDVDGDGSSEIALRYVCVEQDIHGIRYSMDADGDANGPRPYDYDFSVTALAAIEAGVSSVRLDEGICELRSIRSIPAGPCLTLAQARRLAENARWSKTCLTWDELNCNTQADVAQEPHERWEGLINHASKSGSFEQFGGPPCSPFNKRVEVALTPPDRIQLYYDAADRRLHLLGACEGYVDVDYDLDGRVDMIYTYVDEDQDGLFDWREIDLDADGNPELVSPMGAQALAGRRIFDLEYESISSFYQDELLDVLDQNQLFIDAAKSVLGDMVSRRSRAIEEFWLFELEEWFAVEALGRRIRTAPAGARFYTDLLRDALAYDLREAYQDLRQWPQIENACGRGEYAAAADLLLEATGGQMNVTTKTMAPFAQRIPLQITNPLGDTLENWPVVLDVARIRARAEDFNPRNCAVAPPERWVDWREAPHQLDQLGPGREEIAFLADLPPGTTTWYLYYSLQGERKTNSAARTRTDEDWAEQKVNIGWESTLAAYRAYTGYFDFFGKQTYHNGLRQDFFVFPVSESTTGSYHDEQVWGIDALHVGDTAGIGGLTLYVQDQPYFVFGNRANFAKRQVAAGPVRALVQIVASDIIPEQPDLTLELTCAVYAGRQESQVSARIVNGSRDMKLAPGLVKLLHQDSCADSASGYMGVWGRQDDMYKIGDIGMGIIAGPAEFEEVIDLEHQRNLLCKTSGGRLDYWIIGDWREGRRVPFAPPAGDWKRQLEELSRQLFSGVAVSIGASEIKAQPIAGGQTDHTPWWIAQTAMTPDGRIDLAGKPWWDRASEMKLGQSFVIEDGAGARTMVRSEELKIRSGQVVEAIVWIIDDDEDAITDGWGDGDSDCFVVDYHCDGIVDRMVDYIDNDGDNDPDEMDIRYFTSGKLNYAWFGEDIDDDNRMWSLTGYEYDGEYFNSDPYGDNVFYMNKFNPADGVWSPISECPFAFYDIDGDGFSEVVIRASAVPLAYDVQAHPDYANTSYRLPWSSDLEQMGIVNIRYSFDVDNGSSPQTPVHYEMGFNMVASQPYQFPNMARFNARRRPPQTTCVIPWADFRSVADNFAARQIGFSWHENFDDTIAIGRGDNPQDDWRWEGIFWTWQRRFMENSGHPTQEYNVRREFTSKPTERRMLYYSEVDRRIHLFGAEEGWIKVGYFAGLSDLGEIRMFDTDANGFFDRWEVYQAGSPEPVRIHTVRDEKARRIGFDIPAISTFYTQSVLPEAMNANDKLMVAMSKVTPFDIPQELQAAMTTGSPDFRRYAQDVARELHYQKLRQSLLTNLTPSLQARYAQEKANPSRRAWHGLVLLTRLDAAYGQGDYDEACEVLRKLEEQGASHE